MAASKYRFVTATEDKQDKQIQNVNPTGAIWDCSSLMACSSEFIAVPWATPGAISIFKTGVPFTTKPTNPYLYGHSGAVIDVAFSPFNARLLASGGDDATVKIWNIPAEGITEKSDASALTLTGHTKKVGMLQFHPAANNVLATGSTDNTVKIWDLTVGKQAFSMSPTEDQLLSINFNIDGSLMCATSKDKKVSVFDSRTGAVVASAAAHEGIKNQRAVWAKRRNQIITCGFGKAAACREVKLWDPRNMATALYTMEVDKQSAVLMPFIDEDTGLYYLGGKGEGAIRYYELRDDAVPIVPASSYNSSDLAKGLCMAPKAILDVAGNELTRFYKLTSKSVVGVHLNLPRRGTDFQADFFPPTFAGVPAIEAADFIAGKNASPLLQDMKAVYEKNPTPVIIGAAPVAAKPATPQPAPTPKAETPVTPASPVEAKVATPVAATPSEATPVAATPVEAKIATPVAATPVEATPVSSPPAEEKASTAASSKATTVPTSPVSAVAPWDGVSVPTKEQLPALVAQLAAELAKQQETIAKIQAALAAAQ